MGSTLAQRLITRNTYLQGCTPARVIGHMKNERKPLNENQLAEHSRLRAIWDLRKRELGGKLTQHAAAEALGMTQGAFSQYLTGKIPLNTDVIGALAALLDFDPTEVRPHFARGDYKGHAPSVLVKPTVDKVKADIQTLTPAERIELLKYVAESLGDE